MRKKDKIEYMEKLFIKAYRADFSPPEFPEEWHKKLMRDIRKINYENEDMPASFFDRLFPEKIILRFACITSACALFFLLFALISGNSINNEFIKLLFYGPAGMETLAILGL